MSVQKVIAQSFFIWLFAAMHVTANAFMIPKFLSNGQYGAIIFINVMLGPLTIPAVYLFFNYLRHSAHKDFIVTYNCLKMVDRKQNATIEIISPEIERIELHQNLYPYSTTMNLLQWSDQEYFCFIDKHGKKIIVPSYIMSIIDFWTDTLTRRVSSDKLVKYEALFPVIRQ